MTTFILIQKYTLILDNKIVFSLTGTTYIAILWKQSINLRLTCKEEFIKQAKKKNKAPRMMSMTELNCISNTI